MVKVAIIGGGLAGLSLATELVDADYEVVVLEKNNYLGGRASSIMDKKTNDPVPIGPHVFVSAYNNLQRFFKKIGSEENILWEDDVFLEIFYGKKHQIINHSRFPPPFYMFPWFANDKILTWHEKLSNLNLMRKLFFMPRHPSGLDEIDAYTFLKNNGVKDGAIEKFWSFFAVALLNIPLEKCSAEEFSRLILQWGGLKHRKFGFAKMGLGDTYTENAEDYIGRKNILKNTEVKKISVKDGKVEHLMLKNGKKIHADLYVSAVTPVELNKIIPKNIFKNLHQFEGVPYISVNLWFDRKITNKKFWILAGGNINTDFYDNSNIYKGNRNYSLIASNIIYSKEYEKMNDEKIVNKTIEELKHAFPDFDAKLVHYRVHRIPYAIYAPLVGVRKYKLSNKTHIKNLYIAGDWTAQDLTQCMESAVRSGYRCAELILNKKICDNPLV